VHACNDSWFRWCTPIDRTCLGPGTGPSKKDSSVAAACRYCIRSNAGWKKNNIYHACILWH
jgi:hypothetical protein